MRQAFGVVIALAVLCLSAFAQLSERAKLEAAVQAHPDSATAWYELGLLLGQVPDFRGAEASFRKAVAIIPSFAEAQYGLGVALVADPQEKLDWKGAMDACRAALKVRPEYPAASTLLGHALLETGDPAGAILQLKTAAKLAPDSAEAHYYLGRALDETGEAAAAAVEYRSALARRASYPEAAISLGKLMLRSGDAAGAERMFTTALRINPDSTDAHYNRARALQTSGRKADAASEFAIARDLSERSAAALRASRLSNDGLALAAKGDFAGAERLLREAIAQKPDYGVSHFNLGLILADGSRYAEAADELVKAASLLPGQPKPWVSLGRLFHTTQDWNNARAALRHALDMSPADAGALQEREAIERDAGPGTPNAAQQLGAASNTASEHLAFARILIRKNDLQGALGELLRSLSLEPNMLAAREEIAKVYRMTGDRNRARLETFKLDLLRAPQNAP